MLGRRADAAAFYFFKVYGDHRDLHSFPARRTSDLSTSERSHAGDPHPLDDRHHGSGDHPEHHRGRERGAEALRSEEHTSELQSRQYLVCRLLLEKTHNDNSEYAVSCSLCDTKHTYT